MCWAGGGGRGVPGGSVGAEQPPDGATTSTLIPTPRWCKWLRGQPAVRVERWGGTQRCSPSARRRNRLQMDSSRGITPESLSGAPSGSRGVSHEGWPRLALEVACGRVWGAKEGGSGGVEGGLLWKGSRRYLFPSSFFFTG